MSFHAIFLVDGGKPEGYELVASKLAFVQARDDKGRPSSEVFGSMIALRIVSTDDKALVEWMLGGTDRRNGKIQYFRNDQESVFKEVSFTNAYCLNFKDSFNPGERQGSFVTDVYISPESTIVQGVTHTNQW